MIITISCVTESRAEQAKLATDEGINSQYSRYMQPARIRCSRSAQNDEPGAADHRCPSGRTMSARVGGTTTGRPMPSGVASISTKATHARCFDWPRRDWCRAGPITSPAFILAELPAGTRAVVLAEVDGPADELTFASAADVTATWAHSAGRGSRDDPSAGEDAQDVELAARRLLRLGGVQVARRQGAACPAHRRPRRQSQMDAGRGLLAARRGRRAQHAQRLKHVPLRWNRDML